MERDRTPFRQLPFAELPELPRVPHPYFETKATDVELPDSAVGPTRIHVREHGDGSPLLCVHGLMTTSYSFRYMFEPLGRHFRVIAPDLPGCGRSALHVAGRLDPVSLGRLLVELVDALGIRGCPVLGNSLGGYVMMHAALEDPAAFSRLLDLHSPGMPLVRLRALRLAMRSPLVPVFQRYVRGRAERFAHQNVHYFDETLKSREEAREYGRPLATEEGVRSFSRYLSETLDPRSMDDFARTLTGLRDRGAPFPIPLRLVYARRDPMVPPAVGAWLAALVPSAEMVWLDRGSHFAHVDAPDLFAPIALDFLRT